MQTTGEQKSVRYENVFASSRGIAELHGKKVVIFVPADEIKRITLRFGKSEHRPIVSMGIGVVFAVVGIFGLVEFIIATRAYRYELGMMTFGAIGGSLIFDTLKERYFLEIEKKNGICRLIFPKNASKDGIDKFCNEARTVFNYQIQDSI